MKKNLLKKLIASGLLLVALLGITAFALLRYYSPGTPVDPVIAVSGPSVTLMDFSQPPVVSPVSRGWFHVKFLTKPEMQISFDKKEGRDSMRCATENSGSIFGRFTDIELAKYPMLHWGWFVEVPVVSDIAEDLPAGDDHPVRFLVQFSDSGGADHYIEIIWSNGKYMKGDWKIIKEFNSEFHHYVADGGNAKTGENTGAWREESANLLDLYQTATKRSDNARLKYISVFCDTDNTKTKSIAYVSTVSLGEVRP